MAGSSVYAATIGVPEAKKEILSLSPEDMGRDIFELSNPLVWWCEKNREELFALPHPPLRGCGANWGVWQVLW